MLLLVLVLLQNPPIPQPTQSLAELARQEKLRRQKVGQVRHRIIFLDSRSKGSADPTRTGSAPRTPKRSDSDSSVGSDKLRTHLGRKAPRVWRALRGTRADLRSAKKRLRQVEARSLPFLRNGRLVENPALKKKRKLVEGLRTRLKALEQEWRTLNTLARRNRIPPGLLRGMTLP